MGRTAEDMSALDDGVGGAGPDPGRRRAALQAIAYGPDATPAEAQAARRALDALDLAPGRPVVTETRDARPTGADRTDSMPRGADRVPSGAGPAAPAPPDPTSARASDVAPVTALDDGRSSGSGSGRAPRRGAWGRLPVRLRRVGLVAIVGTALASFGVGALVGTTIDQQRSRPSVVAATNDGERTLAALLSAPQTFADQIPGAVSAPVRLHSTRLVFTNRSLSADDAQTPWDVYAAVGTNASVVCLLATADGRTASTSCFPRADALTGSVTLVTQSESGTLTVHVRGGVVSGRVRPSS
ncbi:hypothetical protein DEI82_03740 [Curtobacterium sp. MCBD17_019]|nr:hypothetical protein DEI82_03740 [Curtobacterium sp. MCBD17_019]